MIIPSSCICGAVSPGKLTTRSSKRYDLVFSTWRADKMLFMAAEMERDLIRERTLDELRAAGAQGRRGGRRPAVDEDVLAVAQR